MVLYNRFRVSGKTQLKNRIWGHLAVWTVFTVYFYVFMEWLFFVTKPSFMSALDWFTKVKYLLTDGFVLSLAGLALLLVPLLLIQFIKSARVWRVVLALTGLIPAGILAVTSLLMIDNFSYTVFKFGVVSTQGYWRSLYAFLFLGLVFVWARWILLKLRRAENNFQTDLDEVVENRKFAWRFQFLLPVVLLGISLVLDLPALVSATPLVRDMPGTTLTRQPNILILGSDGVTATHLSLYGYARETSPNLENLANDSLVVEHAFANGSKTTGSTISMLTGKLPTHTRVLYYPDILHGQDSFQHLPGILHSRGYTTIQMGFPYYLDANTQNLIDGFDLVNDQPAGQNGFAALARLPVFGESGYFLSVLVQRASERLEHAFFIRTMTNPFEEVSNSKYKASDDEKISHAIDILREAQKQNEPVFLHIHLMGTHGGLFKPSHPLYSKGKQQSVDWETDFYDDAIRDFDSYVGTMVDQLSQMGDLDNTILVIYSDHAQQFQTDKPVPFLIRFPNGEYAGRIENNAELADLPETLLDYLGVPVPDWMDGRSLLNGQPDPARIIFDADISTPKTNEQGIFAIDPQSIKPPFYQYGSVRVIVCQKWYLLDLKQYSWTSGEVEGYQGTCPESSLPSEQAVQQALLNRLQSDGFDVSSLSNFFNSSGSLSFK